MCSLKGFSINPSGKEIRISIRGLGNPPSFKNKKRIVTNPSTGKPFLATASHTKQWMKAAIESIASTLRSVCQTRGGGTTPACWRRFAMRSLPLDDNWQVLEIGSVRTEQVPKGQEGADIILTCITDQENSPNTNTSPSPESSPTNK